MYLKRKKVYLGIILALFWLPEWGLADVSGYLSESTVKAGESITITGVIPSNTELNLVITAQKDFSPENALGNMERLKLLKIGENFGFKKDTVVPYLYYIITSNPELYGYVKDKRFGGAFFFKGLYKSRMFKLKRWKEIPEQDRRLLGPVKTEEQWNLFCYVHEESFGIEVVGKEKTCIGNELIFSRSVVADYEKANYYWNKGTCIALDKETGKFTVSFRTFRHTCPNTKFDVYVNGKQIPSYVVEGKGFWLPLGWRYVNLLVIILGAIVAGTFYSMIGASGGLLMAAFQIMFIGTAGPIGINSANVLKPSNLALTVASNISSLYRYWWKERRLAVTVAVFFAIGTFLGSFVIGPPLSAKYLNMAAYKPWLALLILIIVIRNLNDLTNKSMKKRKAMRAITEKFNEQVKKAKKDNQAIKIGSIETIKFNLFDYKFKFWGETFRINIIILAICGILIGIVSAGFGIGGGFLLVPTVVFLGNLPMYAAVPISLFACMIGSLAGIIRYILLGYPPDIWILLAIVIGGLIGGVIGSKLQGMFSEKTLKITLVVVLIVIAFRFIGIEIWV